MCNWFWGKNVKAAYGVCWQRGRSRRLQNAGRRNFLFCWILIQQQAHLYVKCSQSYLCRKVQLKHNLMSWKLDTNTFLMVCDLPSNLLWIDYSSSFEFELKSGPIVSISGFVDFLGSSGSFKIWWKLYIQNHQSSCSNLRFLNLCQTMMTDRRIERKHGSQIQNLKHNICKTMSWIVGEKNHQLPVMMLLWHKQKKELTRTRVHHFEGF